MNPATRRAHDTLDLSAAERVDQVCDRFEKAWKEGRQPRAEEFLGEPAEPERSALVFELVRLELYHRRQRGERPTLDEYGQRFPKHVELIRPEFDAAAPTIPGCEILEELMTPSTNHPPAPAIPGYEILEELGRSMGIVYKAWQVSPPRFVALKMIRAGAHASKQELARFVTEAEAVARLQHPNIVQIYEVGEHDGRPFFSLEFCGGGSLDRKLATPLPPEQAAKLAETLARAVHVAHQQHILHRDLKPANVLLVPSERPEAVPLGGSGNAERYEPRVTDFGLAKKLDEVGVGPTVSGAIMGTPPYMAPEQAEGHNREVGPGTDVYGLGAVLYACLTGRPPFQAATIKETLWQVINWEPVPPSRLQPKVPRDLEAVCLKCLEKEQGRRYASAEDLADDLRRFLNGEPTRARPVTVFVRVGRWCRRYPEAAGLAAATAALLLSLALGAIHSARQSEASLHDEMLKNNAYAAQGVASTFLWALEHMSRPLANAAEDPELRRLLKEKDQAGLKEYCKRLGGGSGAPGGPPAGGPVFQSWYALDKDGILLAATPLNPDRDILKTSYAFRDYFQGAKGLAESGRTGRAAVHVSKVFKADNDGLYKFAMAAAVRQGREADSPVVGVIAVTQATNSAFSSLDLNDERRIAVLAGPSDRNPPRGPPVPTEASPNKYVIVLHPAYQLGDEAIPLPNERLSKIPLPKSDDEFHLPDRNDHSLEPSLDTDYHDPVGDSRPAYAKRWVAAFAPVGNTGYVVIVQQQYDQALEQERQSKALVGNLLLWSGGPLVLVLVFATVTLARAPRRR